MTFTYDSTSLTANDLTRVRFYIQDTDSTIPLFTDEEINFMISEKGTYKKAVIACLEAILMRISLEPDSTADWLKVEWGRSVKGYETMLAKYKKEWNLTANVAVSRHVTRLDSLQKTTPDWDEDTTN